MPRISLWKDEAHSHDFKFFDRRISEMFTIGGTGINIHKYLGVNDDNDDICDTVSCGSEIGDKIQDLLFLENRDRKYDTSVYGMRGMYQISDSDFDLSQFGLFLSADTVFITFHMKDMYDMMGRKLISGDVLELPHLKDFYALDEDVPSALRRYYVVQDGSRPAEGYSPTWWPHLWRVKCTPLVDGQEFSQLLAGLGLDGKPLDNDLCDTGCTPSLKDLLSKQKPIQDINDGIIEEAEDNVPRSGYDTSMFYVAPVTDDGHLRDPENLRADMTVIPDTGEAFTADVDNWTADRISTSPKVDIQKSGVYLLGDGLAPNGYPVIEAIEFPINPVVGDFVLRIDYMPDRLFRFDGSRWLMIEDNVRASLSADQGDTLLGGFINNDNITTGTIDNLCSGTTDEKQSLSDILRPKADN